MELGIFAKTFVRPTLAETLQAVADHRLSCVQFNFACAGLPPLPESIPPEAARSIRSALDRHRLRVAALSGTCNLIHPDPAQRAEGVRRLKTVIAAAPAIGAPGVTLCTGTRDPEDMWRAHPDNARGDAWRDLVQSLEKILPPAETRRIWLGIEPEQANVIDSALKARRLLDDLRSPWLKIVFDGANLLAPDWISKQREILRHAVDLLAPDIAISHAKDIRAAPEGGHAAAGQGAMDYVCYISLLAESGFGGPLILHHLEESEAPGCLIFLRGLLDRVRPRAPKRPQNHAAF